MTVKLWLRAESKVNERRVALVPDDARVLLDSGFGITVENSIDRCIPVDEYVSVGCEVAPESSWPEVPADTFILGVKELPEGDAPLHHRHIYFGHAYKDQPGWRRTLSRFASGAGVLYDLECLVDETGRRVAAFGYWAGFAGAAVAVKVWGGQQVGATPALASVGDYPNVDTLLVELSAMLDRIGVKPDMIVIGALGRSGGGAVELGERLGLEITKWDLAETGPGGPFPEIQQHGIFVNCILAVPGCPRFVTAEDIEGRDRRLSVISDVSCDPESAYNPIPIYNRSTSFDDPAIRLTDGPPPLDVTAIDHLPSLLPLEASTDFSRQLTPALLTLHTPEKGVWGRALEQYTKNAARL